MNIHFAGTFMLCKNVSGISLQVLRDFPHVLANLYDFLIHSRFGKNGFTKKTNTCSKSIIETPEKDITYLQSNDVVLLY